MKNKLKKTNVTYKIMQEDIGKKWQGRESTRTLFSNWKGTAKLTEENQTESIKDLWENQKESRKCRETRKIPEKILKKQKDTRKEGAGAGAENFENWRLRQPWEK